MSDEIKADETDERRLLLAHGLLSCIAARVFSGIPSKTTGANRRVTPS